ncbi:DUF3592 domain-containing protein [Acetivibrio clariflavus]|uniref:DUF3592 domain-containing protein n=1 Tax=Acetivibrio clariflavus TaxID=288965 RepID=UPI0031F49374
MGFWYYVKIIIFFIAAVLCLYHGIANFFMNFEILLNGENVKGVVIDSETVVIGEAYESTIEYKTKTGDIYQFKSARDGIVGSELTVRYNKKNPSKAVVYDFLSLCFWPSFKVILGIVLLLGLITGPKFDE